MSMCQHGANCGGCAESAACVFLHAGADGVALAERLRRCAAHSCRGGVGKHGHLSPLSISILADSHGIYLCVGIDLVVGL